VKLEPITIGEVLLYSAGAGLFGAFVPLLLIVGFFLSSGYSLDQIVTVPAFYWTPVGAFLICFVATLRWVLMMYWQQRHD